ncbi:MAG: TetR/AcrR family transcriptional regulator [Caulobacterales bacterium]|uniref:TetR/AcrR family transcriptional regulator n=1 Tax=Glycocaulis sp. TaxID=1969725 RepID=UPI003FA06905
MARLSASLDRKPRRPGRPVKIAPEEQRRRILDAAAAQFARRGFEGASLRDIAGDAGLSHAVIRHFFGSKDDLWDAAAADLFGQMNAAMAEALGQVDLNDPEARMEAQVRATVRTASRIPWLAGFVMQAGLAGGERYETLVERHLRPAYAFTLEPFYQMKEAGRAHVPDAHFLFMLSTNAAIGPFAQSANARALAGLDLSNPAIAERYADVLVTVLKHGALRPAGQSTT